MLGDPPWNKCLGNSVVDYCQKGPETRKEFGFGNPQIICIVVNTAFCTHCLVTTVRKFHFVHERISVLIVLKFAVTITYM